VPTTATSVPEFDDSEYSDIGWESHRLASMILVGSDLGVPWTRFGVTIHLPSPRGTWLICGREPPAQGGGLSAVFETDDGESTVLQAVIEAGSTPALEWMDFYRQLASCPDADDNVFRTAYEPVPLAPESVAGADEVVMHGMVEFDGAGGVESSSLAGVFRVGDVLVQFLVTAPGAEYVAGSPAIAPAIDEVIRLFELSLR
jgi:hypothetical protein